MFNIPSGSNIFNISGFIIIPNDAKTPCASGYFFFNLQAFGLAFFWLLTLLALVVWMAYTFYQVRPLAGFLQIPYILWLLFAAYLSAGVWILNG